MTLISQELSEFALHARAILGLPIPEIRNHGPSASCAVLATGHGVPQFAAVDAALAEPGTALRLFGKPRVEGQRRVAVTLARHPQVNAATSADGRAMTYPAAVNVAVAVAMDDGGLITPVLANADKTDIYSLARAWADLVARARNKQLQPDEYRTGTFTLSNLGMFGVDRFDAILPPGTGAILAVAASRPSVVAGKDGSIRVASQMQVNLTCDHRTIYGADAAAFLKDLAQLIETNPESLAV